MDWTNMTFESVGMYTYLRQHPQSTYEQLLNASADDAARVTSILQELLAIGILIPGVDETTGEAHYTAKELNNGWI